MPAGVCHVLQLLHDLIMDLCEITRFGFAYSEIDQSGVFVHLQEKATDMAHLALGVPIVLHNGVAFLKLPCILDDVVGVVRLCVLGSAPVRLPLGVPPFPGMVRDANGEPGPGKGAENNLAVLDVHPLLAVQVKSPQVTVDEEVQPGLQLRESGCHGIVNQKGVEPSNLSEMYSEDALETMNRTKTLKEPLRDGVGCSPRHLVALYCLDTCHPTRMSKMPLYLSTYISL